MNTVKIDLERLNRYAFDWGYYQGLIDGQAKKPGSDGFSKVKAAAMATKKLTNKLAKDKRSEMLEQLSSQAFDWGYYQGLIDGQSSLPKDGWSTNVKIWSTATRELIEQLSGEWRLEE